MAKTWVPGSEKRNCQIYTSQKEKNKFFISQLVTGGVFKTELTDASLREYLELLSMTWAEQVADPKNSERPSSSWIPSPTWSSPSWTQKLAEMAPAQVKRRQMVRTMVKFDNIEHTFSESSWKLHA